MLLNLAKALVVLFIRKWQHSGKNSTKVNSWNGSPNKSFWDSRTKTWDNSSAEALGFEKSYTFLALKGSALHIKSSYIANWRTFVPDTKLLFLITADACLSFCWDPPSTHLPDWYQYKPWHFGHEAFCSTDNAGSFQISSTTEFTLSFFFFPFASALLQKIGMFSKLRI